MVDANRAPGRVARWLKDPRAPWVFVGFGVILALASVGPYLAFDDYVLGLAARGDPRISGLAQGGFDLFTFTTGRPADNRALMDQGVLLPWWSDEHLKIAFFRPVASLTHRLDFAFWPGSPALMHVQSVLWFGVALAAVAWLYRRLEPAAMVGAIATFLYAVDDAHGPAVSWIANRNALIATALGAAAIGFHDMWRRDGRRSAAVLAALSLLVGLLAGEFALGAVAYLGAYALCLERGPLGKRAASVLPYAAIVVFWRAGHRWGGYGARGSGAYVDPLRDPVQFFADLPAKLLVLIHGQLGAPPSDLAFLGPPEDRPLLFVLAAVTVLAAALVLTPLVRRDPKARFWAVGAVLAAVPVSASFPSDRLLLFVGIGGAALLARLFAPFLDRAAGARRRGLAGLVTAGFFALHVVVAPVLLPFRAAQMLIAGRVADRSVAALEKVNKLEARTVVIVNAPIDILASYIQPQRAWQRAPRPAHLYWLASASSRLAVSRPTPTSLVVRPQRGYLYSPLERHYRGDTHSLPPGARVALSEMTARVLDSTVDGRPGAVAFEFHRPLESEDYIFLVWKKNRYEVLSPPEVGTTLSLPRQDFIEILMSSLLHDGR